MNIQKYPLSSSHIEILKWLALFFMVIDHTGYILSGDNYIFRSIGRLSYPIFGFVLAHNIYYFTKSLPHMLLKLFIFGVITQPIALLAMPVAYSGSLNILFSFLASGIIIFAYRCKNISYKLLIYPVGFLLSFVSDYGLFGMLMVFSFYLFFETKKHNYIFLSIIFILFSEINHFPMWVIIPAILAPSIPLMIRMPYIIKRSPKNLFYLMYIFQFLLLSLILQ